MIPVVAPEEMAEIDRMAPEPAAVLIGRAGSAVAAVARSMLGGTYGRRVVVVAGKGNNGNDGREAARRLRARGVAATVIEAVDAAGSELADCDLVIDAAYGTGFRGSFDPPRVRGGTNVLAVDIPSGVSGLTGALGGEPLKADRTVTFAALKPGLLLQPGAAFTGDVDVADIGLDTSGASTHLVEAGDVATLLPERPPGAHKWQSAVWIVAGSPGMGGAASLACAGAQRAGAGYVRQSTPGGWATDVPVEVVKTELPEHSWSTEVIEDQGRFGALVVGNGLGLDPVLVTEVRRLVGSAILPTVVDADGITALGRQATEVVQPHTIVTPHDGEFARLTGRRPGPDRIGDVRALASDLGCVVLLKGPATIVAAPDGRVLVTNTGDARLATAGTGDVLAGVIGSLAAQGMAPFEAAATGSFIHGCAGALGFGHGLVAGDVARNLPAAMQRLLGGA